MTKDELQKTLSGEYFNERLDRSFGSDYTSKQLEALKGASIAKDISVNKSIRAINAAISHYGWVAEPNSGHTALIFKNSSNPNVKFEYKMAIEGGNLPGVANSGEHLDSNTLIWYRTDSGKEGLCSVQEAEFDKLRQLAQGRNEASLINLLEEVNERVRAGQSYEAMLKKASDYTYPATKVRDIVPLNMTAAQQKKMMAEIEAEGQIDPKDVKSSLMKSRELNLSLYLRDLSTEHYSDIMEQQRKSLNKDKLSARERKNAQQAFEDTYKDIMIQVAMVPVNQRSKLLKQFEGNSQYDIVTKSPSWGQFKQNITGFANAVSRVTYTNTSQTSHAKGKIALGDTVAVSAGQEYAQHGNKGGKQSLNIVKPKNSKAGKHGTIDIGSTTAAVKNYAGSGTSTGSDKGFRLANLASRKGGTETREGLINFLTDVNFKDNKNVEQAIVRHIQSLGLGRDATKKKINEFNAIAAGGDKNKLKQFFEGILTSDQFLFSSDFEQFLLSESIAESGELDYIKSDEVLDFTTEFQEKFNKEYKKRILKKYKESLKKDSKEKELVEQFLLGSVDVDIKEIDKLVEKAKKVESIKDKDWIYQQDAYREVFGTNNSFEYEDLGGGRIRQLETAKFKTGDKIYDQSGEHGIVKVVKDLAIAQQMLAQGYSPEEIFNSDGTLKVHGTIEAIKGEDKAARKAAVKTSTIENEFTALSKQALQKGKTIENIRNIFVKTINKVLDQNAQAIFAAQGHGSKFKDIVNQITNQLINSDEDGNIIMGNIYSIINGAMDGLTPEEQKALLEFVPMAAIAAMSKMVDPKGKQFKVTSNERQIGISTTKENGSFISLNALGVGNVPFWGDPTSKGGRPMTFGQKLVDDLVRQGQSAAKFSGLEVDAEEYARSVNKIYEANKPTNATERAALEGIVHNLEMNSVNQKVEELVKNGAHVIKYGEHLIEGDNKLTSEADLNGTGRSGFNLTDFNKSYFRQIYDQQKAGRDVYLGYDYSYTDENGNFIESEAIKLLNLANAFVGIKANGELCELDDPECVGVVPADTAEGMLAIEHIGDIQSLIGTRVAQDVNIKKSRSKKKRQSAIETKNRAAGNMIKANAQRLNDKDSALYKSLDKAPVSHSMSGRVISADMSHALFKSKAGRALMSRETMRGMLQQAAGENEGDFVTALKEQSNQLGLEITDKDSTKDIIEKILDAIDIDKEGFDPTSASGLLSFLTRYPLLTGENVPIAETFVTSKGGLDNGTIMVDDMYMKMLNADVDGDQLYNVLGQVRSELQRKDLTEEERNELENYYNVLQAQYLMFRARANNMRKVYEGFAEIKDKQEKAGNKKKKDPTHFLSQTDLDEKANPEVAAAAEIATRRNQDYVGTFDLMRQAYLNFNKFNDRDQNINTLLTSEFLTALPQETISAKKIFAKMFEKTGNEKEAQDLTTNAMKEFQEMLRDPNTFSTEAGWKKFGKLLEKWGIAENLDEGGVAFSEDRAAYLASRAYELTGDDRWLNGEYATQQLSFANLGKAVRAENAALKGGRFRDKDGKSILLKEGLGSIATGSYNYNPTASNADADTLAREYGEKRQEEVTALTGVVQALMGFKGGLVDVSKIFEEFAKRSENIAELMEQLGLSSKKSGMAVTSITKAAGISNYNEPGFSNETINEFFSNLKNYMEGKGDRNLGFVNEASRDAFIKQMSWVPRGNAANIAQFLTQVRNSGIQGTEGINSLEDFLKFYQDNKGAKIGDKTLEELWEGNKGTSKEEYYKEVEKVLGEGSTNGRSFNEVLKDLEAAKLKGVNGAAELYAKSHELIGGPSQLLNYIKVIDQLTGSNLSGATSTNIKNIMQMLKGEKFIGSETGLMSAFDLGSDKEGSVAKAVYGFADIITKNNEGRYTIGDIKTGKNVSDMLKPEYIAQVASYAYLAQRMKEQIGEKSFDEFKNGGDYETYKKYLGKDLTAEEFEFIKNFDPNNVDLALYATDEKGSARTYRAKYDDLLKYNGLKEKINRMLKIGLSPEEARKQIAENYNTPEQIAGLRGAFSIDGGASFITGEISEDGKDSKKKKEDKSKEDQYLDKQRDIYQLEKEKKRLEKENQDLQSEFLKLQIDKLTKLIKEKEKEVNKFRKDWTRSEKTASTRHWNAEEEYLDTVGDAKEVAAAEKDLASKYRERNRLATSLYRNRKQQSMTMDPAELAALREQERALVESAEPLMAEIDKLEKSDLIKKSEKAKKITEDAKRNLQLALTGEDVKFKGQNTFWGQMSSQFNRLFTNFIKFGAVSRIMQTVRRDIQKVVQAAKELDKAMTNLRIVSGKNGEEAKNLIDDYAQLAKQIGVTTTEVATSANEWFNKMSRSLTNKLL